MTTSTTGHRAGVASNAAGVASNAAGVASNAAGVAANAAGVAANASGVAANAAHAAHASGHIDVVANSAFIAKERTGPWDTSTWFEIIGQKSERPMGPGSPDREILFGDLYAEAFDDNIAETQGYRFHIRHHNLKDGPVSLHLHTTHKILAPTGTRVRWKTTWWAAKKGQAFVAAGTVVSATQTQLAQHVHDLWGDTAILDMPSALRASVEPDMLVMVTIQRDVSHGDDDFAHDIFLLEADLHCRRGQSGTTEIGAPFTSAGYS